MKKAIVFLTITFSTIILTLFANIFQAPSHLQSSYDMPTKCSSCGEWHIPGTPCRK